MILQSTYNIVDPGDYIDPPRRGQPNLDSSLQALREVLDFSNMACEEEFYESCVPSEQVFASCRLYLHCIRCV